MTRKLKRGLLYEGDSQVSRHCFSEWHIIQNVHIGFTQPPDKLGICRIAGNALAPPMGELSRP